MKKSINIAFAVILGLTVLFVLPSCNKTKVADEHGQVDGEHHHGDKHCGSESDKSSCGDKKHGDKNEHACKSEDKKACCKSDSTSS